MTDLILQSYFAVLTIRVFLKNKTNGNKKDNQSEYFAQIIDKGKTIGYNIHIAKPCVQAFGTPRDALDLSKGG